MRKLSKKISMLMVLAMLVSLFSGVVSASAASAWSFKSAKYDVAVGETIEMEKNEYADFDLYKNDAAPAGYTVKWASDNSDAVWVNAKTGQLRADKFGKADLGDKAVISATFTNTATKKSATRSFTIVVAEKSEYTIATKIGEAVLGAEALTVGTEYALTSTVTADGKAIEATVAYTVDGKAVTALKFDAAGEYTVVATATLDGKVIATAKTVVVAAKADDSIVSAKQTSMTKALLVLGSETAAKAVAENKSVAVDFVAENSTYEIEALVKGVSVDANNKSAVVVEMFDQFIPKYTYKFAVGDDTKSFVAVTAGEEDIASISVATWFKFVADQYNPLVAQAYNAQGVDITDAKEVKEYLSYYLDWELVDGATEDCDLNNGTLKFYEGNKSVVVKAELNMGYNDDGTEKIALTAVGKVESVPSYIDKPATGFALIDTENNYAGFSHFKYVYSNDTIEMIADELPGYLGAKYTQQNNTYWSSWDDTEKWVWQGSDTGADAKDGYTYRSSNEEVCFIDADTGKVYPSKAGTARLYVMNPDGVAIGSVLVKVYAEQILKNFTATLNKNTLSVNTVEEDDTIILTLAAQDQMGRPYDFSDESKIAKDLEISTTLDKDLISIGAPTYNNNGGYNYAITADDSIITADAKGVTLIYKVWDADDEDQARIITRRVSFNVKDVIESEDGKIAIVSNDKTIDTKLNQWGAGAYEVNLTANRTDNKGYFLDMINYTMQNGGKPSVSTGDYTLVITKNNSALDGDEYDKFVQKYVTEKINGKDEEVFKPFFKPVVNTWFGKDDYGNDMFEAEKISKGTYRFKLYVGTGKDAKHVDTLTVTVKDTTEKFTVVRNATQYGKDGIAKGNLKDFLKLYRDGVKYDDWKYSVVGITPNPTKSVDGVSIYIEDVTYRLGAFNEYFAYENWDRNDYEFITVPVNMKFYYAE